MLGAVFLSFGVLSASVFRDQMSAHFVGPGIIIISLAGLIGYRIQHRVRRISHRDALLFVTLSWTALGLLGGLPFMLVEHLSFTDASFEALSGLTTTGATVIAGLDTQPRSVLMYRQFLQWFGGLGVIILVVAILPMLNIGGMKLYRAETPGPMKDDKLAPRISNAARYLWYVYVAITLACALSFHLAGMDWFDALAHSFSTVSTGGFSTHDASLGYFQSARIEAVADIFMALGAINFGLHYAVFRHPDPRRYWQDEETRWFILILLSVSVLVAMGLLQLGHLDNWTDASRLAVFQVISFVTSTGFASTNFGDWPQAIQFCLVMGAFVGGCAGSTAGGGKVIRWIVAARSVGLEMRQLLHPRGVFQLKYRSRTIQPEIIDNVRAFLSLMFLVTGLLTLGLIATGLDVWSAFTAVAACINVLGPAFGTLGSNFQPVSDTGTWILFFAMILGRLELFTVLVLFTPTFWRH